MNAKWLLALPAAFLACGILLAACGGGGSNAYAHHRQGNEDWEYKATLADMPSFLDKYSGRTKHLYSIVGKYEDIMKLMNCYCGCMQYEDDPHSSLFRYYVLTRTLKRSDIWQTPAHHPFIGSLAGDYVFVDCSHTLTAAFKAGSHTSN
jgi:hypothetical protein